MSVVRPVGVALFVALAAWWPRPAAGYTFLRALTEVVGQPNSTFGAPVTALGTSTVVIGAAYAPAAGVASAGTVSLVDPATGAFIRTFQKPDAAMFDQFGFAIATLGGDVLIGAPGDDTGAPDAGAVYRFDAATGALRHVYQKPFPKAGDQFGFSIATLANGDVLIGAPFDAVDGPAAGAVYLLDGATGDLLQTFHNPSPSDPYFGLAITASDAVVAVGSPQDSTGATGAGAVYLFDAATGALLRRIQKPVPAANDFFGAPIAMLGTELLAAAPNDDTGAVDAGVVYLFDQSGVLLRTFQRPLPGAGEYFGQALATVGANVLIGAPKDALGAPDAGAAYLFDGNTGALLQVLQRPTPIAGETVGMAVAALGTSLLLGTSHDGAGFGTGSVLVFSPCGDGTTDPGEQCDAGGVTGSCCTPSCTLLPENDACDDGDACTTNDHCTADGTCVAGDPMVCSACLACDSARGCVAAPAVGCDTGPSSLTIRSGHTRALRWRWRSTTGLAKLGLGSPTSTTSYDVCIYAPSDDGESAALVAALPGGGTCGTRPCWTETDDGFDYLNADASPDGLSRARFRIGIADEGRILLRGRGPNLRTPAMPLGTPLTVQLRRRDAPACWESTLTRPLHTTSPTFRARSK